eukprot:TRINITY_DN18802_c0_g1_i1.p2 TRINITY_DN18802_c0_g1~~TRINITY_DN18802_c0_g1_i1.p2  ORF type:complete len:177 (+),score=16.58 TRINITY_DN18802_c0_g1_i1:376-906(+)
MWHWQHPPLPPLNPTATRSPSVVTAVVTVRAAAWQSSDSVRLDYALCGHHQRMRAKQHGWPCALRSASDSPRHCANSCASTAARLARWVAVQAAPAAPSSCSARRGICRPRAIRARASPRTRQPQQRALRVLAAAGLAHPPAHVVYGGVVSGPSLLQHPLRQLRAARIRRAVAACR